MERMNVCVRFPLSVVALSAALSHCLSCSLVLAHLPTAGVQHRHSIVFVTEDADRLVGTVLFHCTGACCAALLFLPPPLKVCRGPVIMSAAARRLLTGCAVPRWALGGVREAEALCSTSDVVRLVRDFLAAPPLPPSSLPSLAAAARARTHATVGGTGSRGDDHREGGHEGGSTNLTRHAPRCASRGRPARSCFHSLQQEEQLFFEIRRIK